MHPWIVQKLADQRIDDFRKDADNARLRRAARHAAGDKRRRPPETTMANGQSNTADVTVRRMRQRDCNDDRRPLSEERLEMASKQKNPTSTAPQPQPVDKPTTPHAAR